MINKRALIKKSPTKRLLDRLPLCLPRSTLLASLDLLLSIVSGPFRCILLLVVFLCRRLSETRKPPKRQTPEVQGTCEFNYDDFFISIVFLSANDFKSHKQIKFSGDGAFVLAKCLAPRRHRPSQSTLVFLLFPHFSKLTETLALRHRRARRAPISLCRRCRLRVIKTNCCKIKFKAFE